VTAFPKPRPAKLEREERKAAREAFDSAESERARGRAKGQCEVVTGWTRCRRRDTETHHLKGGIGVRGRGESSLAEWKLRACHWCHQEITARVLVPVDPQADARTITYRRVS